SELVARLRAAHAVFVVGALQTVIALDSIKHGADGPAPPPALEQVEAPVSHAPLRDVLEARARRRIDGLDQLLDRAIECAVAAALGRVDDEKAAKGQKSAQPSDLVFARHRELAVARKIKDGRLVQVGIGKLDDRWRWIDLDGGAL